MALWIIPVLLPTAIALVILATKKVSSKRTFELLPFVYVLMFIGIAFYSGGKESFEGYFHMLGQPAFLLPNLLTIGLIYAWALMTGQFGNTKTAKNSNLTKRKQKP